MDQGGKRPDELERDRLGGSRVLGALQDLALEVAESLFNLVRLRLLVVKPPLQFHSYLVVLLLQSLQVVPQFVDVG